MFQIDDNFLTSVGYDVAQLSGEKKAQYIEEITNEVNERVSERLVSELDDRQIDIFNSLQEEPDRARAWLDEFHWGYQDHEMYKTLLDTAGNSDDAATFYATALWMNDAVPQYGALIQEELDAYQAELVKMRQAANDMVG